MSQLHSFKTWVGGEVGEAGFALLGGGAASRLGEGAAPSCLALGEGAYGLGSLAVQVLGGYPEAGLHGGLQEVQGVGHPGTRLAPGLALDGQTLYAVGTDGLVR